MISNYIRCAIGAIILLAGVCIREDHIVLAIVLITIGFVKYMVNMKDILKEDSK